jgi:NADH-quinone oxidoreductase subunit C
MSVAGIANTSEVTALLDRFGVSWVEFGPPVLQADRHLDLARSLRDELGFRVFGFVVASHIPSNAETGSAELMRVAYGLRSLGKGSSVATWQLEAREGHSVPSLVPLFAGADWQEREQYDLFGIRFEGHPDMRRIMLPGDWRGHPLRKDYAIDTQVHPWR